MSDPSRPSGPGAVNLKGTSGTSSSKNHLLEDASALLRFSNSSIATQARPEDAIRNQEALSQLPKAPQIPSQQSQQHYQHHQQRQQQTQIQQRSRKENIGKSITPPVQMERLPKDKHQDNVSINTSNNEVNFKASPSPNPANLSPTSNPGPAVAALSVAGNQAEGNKQDHSMKAIVAAAALAAAASTPLPLPLSNSSLSNSSQTLQQQQQLHQQKADIKALEQTIRGHGVSPTTVKQMISQQQKGKDHGFDSNKDNKVDLSKIVEQAIKSENKQKKSVETTSSTKNNESSQESEKPPLVKKKSSRDKKEKSDKTKQTSKKKESAQSVPPYAVGQDSGIIDCICCVNEDDGFTIQCDKCFRWQHASCFNIQANDVPDLYYCELCDPKTFKSRNINVKKMRERQLSLFGGDTDVDKYTNQAPPNLSSSSALVPPMAVTAAAVANDNNNNKKRPRDQQNDDHANNTKHHEENKKKRRSNNKDRSASNLDLHKNVSTGKEFLETKDNDLESKATTDTSNKNDSNNSSSYNINNNNGNINNANNNTNVNNINNNTNNNANYNDKTENNNQPSRKDKSRKKKREEFDDNTNEELITRIESAKDEYYYAVYYNLKQLEYKDKKLEHYFTNSLPHLLNNLQNEYKEKSTILNLTKEELEKLEKPNFLVKNILINENSSAPSSHFKFSGLSNLGVFLKDSGCAKGQLVSEFLGEVDYQVNFFNNPINQFSFWGLPKNYYFFVNYFHKDLQEDSESEDEDTVKKDFNESTEKEKGPADKLSNLACSLEHYLKKKKTTNNEDGLLAPLFINCKTSGNAMRFVRKSCYPNCQIVPVISNGEVKFYLQAIKNIAKDAELSVGWEFDFNKLFYKVYSDTDMDIDKHNDTVKSNFNSKLTNAEKIQLINQVEFVLGQYKCGCYSVSSNVNNSKCKLLRIKKMGSYFYRSSRKGSKLSKVDGDSKNNDNISQSSIKSRLLNRDRVISSTLADLEAATADQEQAVGKDDNGGGHDNTDINNDTDNDSQINLDTAAKGTPTSKENFDKLFKPAKKRETVVEHPALRKRRSYLARTMDYAILNSRAQLAKAIVANCLSIPVPVKTNFNLDGLSKSNNSSNNSSSHNNVSKKDSRVSLEFTSDKDDSGPGQAQGSVDAASVGFGINAEVSGGCGAAANAAATANATDTDNEIPPHIKRENSSEVKKVKKMSFADFLKKKPT